MSDLSGDKGFMCLAECLKNFTLKMESVWLL